jgi:hypothetical protein
MPMGSPKTGAYPHIVTPNMASLSAAHTINLKNARVLAISILARAAEFMASRFAHVAASSQGSGWYSSTVRRDGAMRRFRQLFGVLLTRRPRAVDACS